ncbi:hypothetical protein BCR44DRAFT_1329700 [Catenaria anguillulae PL171]|uniref:COPII coat assembly protein SEC16 n=1 Tax=Catenaria anguillulae PL171 TaxID=765915 RepID=A0A1Y2H6E9_9FUNG|nr:hypothetical protein BCR44DRAFT_1329700 [Catenaria anguillulae PL171]
MPLGRSTRRYHVSWSQCVWTSRSRKCFSSPARGIAHLAPDFVPEQCPRAAAHGNCRVLHGRASNGQWSAGPQLARSGQCAIHSCRGWCNASLGWIQACVCPAYARCWTACSCSQLRSKCHARCDLGAQARRTIPLVAGCIARAARAGRTGRAMAAERVGSLPQPTPEMTQVWSGQQFALGLEFGEFKQTLLATDVGRLLEPILGNAQAAPIAFPVVDSMQQQQQQQRYSASPYTAPLADYGRRLSTLSNSGLPPAPSSTNMPQTYGFTSTPAPVPSFEAAPQQSLPPVPVSKQASFIGSPQASATVVAQVPLPSQQQQQQQQGMYSQQHLPLMTSPSQNAVHAQQQAPPMSTPMVSSPQSQAAAAPPAPYGQMPPAPMYGSNGMQQQPSSFDVSRSPQQFASAPGMSPGFGPAPTAPPKQRGFSPAPINTIASPVNQPAATAAPASPPASGAAVDEWDDLGFGNSALKKEKSKGKADGQADGSSGSATSPKDTDSGPKSASDSASPADGSGGSSSGIFGIVKSVFGRKKKDGAPGPVKANLGEESTFYFDKELGRWINKNDPSSASMTTSKPPPPPPARTGSAPPGGGAPPHGGSAPPPSMGSMSMNVPPPAAAAAGGLPPAQVGGSVGFGAPARSASPAASIHSISSVASMPPLGTFGLPTPINRGGSVPGSVPDSPSSPGPAGTPPSALSSTNSTPAGSSKGRTRQRPSSSMGFNPIESLGSGGPPPGPASSSLRNMRGRSRYVDVLNPGSGTSSPAPPSGTSTPAPPAAGPSFLPSTGGGQ